MSEQRSPFTDALLQQLEDAGLDLQKPATIEEVAHMLGGALDTVVRMQMSEKVVDEALREMKRRR
ncbi:hypothetical protein [Salinicola aestuarinus]|uniref:hypothetical protein n=1 Tax=Salinicola aestuarinus TaxID=1949082 RepID=UPI000DA1923D|nr:hypothetical protein [Salinicola aestuarinus]